VLKSREITSLAKRAALAQGNIEVFDYIPFLARTLALFPGWIDSVCLFSRVASRRSAVPCPGMRLFIARRPMRARAGWHGQWVGQDPFSLDRFWADRLPPKPRNGTRGSDPQVLSTYRLIAPGTMRLHCKVRSTCDGPISWERISDWRKSTALGLPRSAAVAQGLAVSSPRLLSGAGFESVPRRHRRGLLYDTDQNP